MTMKKLFWTILGAGAAYEVVALANSKDGDTISEYVWESCDRPLVPFFFGMAAGHFFWQRYDGRSRRPARSRKEGGE